MDTQKENFPENPTDVSNYSVVWSEEDREYVATHPVWPSLSWLDADKDKALAGLKQLVSEIQTGKL